MPRPVYSRPFIRTQGLNGDGDLVVVPTGYVYIVRAIAVYWQNTVTSGGVYFEHASTGQTLVFYSGSAGSQESHYLGSRFVFFNSESFRFSVKGTMDADVFASGYQLTL